MLGFFQTNVGFHLPFDDINVVLFCNHSSHVQTAENIIQSGNDSLLALLHYVWHDRLLRIKLYDFFSLTLCRIVWMKTVYDNILYWIDLCRRHIQTHSLVIMDKASWERQRWRAVRISSKCHHIMTPNQRRICVCHNVWHKWSTDFF